MRTLDMPVQVFLPLVPSMVTLLPQPASLQEQKYRGTLESCICDSGKDVGSFYVSWSRC